MVKKFALIFGAMYAVVGILGFIPALVSPPEMTTGMDVHAGHGRLFGLFPVNFWHNIVHLAVGIWGVIAARDFGAAVSFARINAVLFAALTILGLIPATNTLFGLVPIYGHDVWLHALTTALTAYFGFVAPSRAEV